MRAKRAFICVPKASLWENLRDLREKFLKFMSLQGICKSFTAFKALCFNEVAEFYDPVFVPLFQSF